MGSSSNNQNRHQIQLSDNQLSSRDTSNNNKHISKFSSAVNKLQQAHASIGDYANKIKSISAPNNLQSNDDFDSFSNIKTIKDNIKESGKILNTKFQHLNDISNSESDIISSDSEKYPNSLKLTTGDIIVLSRKLANVINYSSKLSEKLMKMENLDINLLKINKDVDDIARIQKEMYLTLDGK